MPQGCLANLTGLNSAMFPNIVNLFNNCLAEFSLFKQKKYCHTNYGRIRPESSVEELIKETEDERTVNNNGGDSHQPASTGLGEEGVGGTLGAGGGLVWRPNFGINRRNFSIPQMEL